MRRIVSFRPSPALVVAVIALLVAVGGVAAASIPGPGGVVSSCYKKKSGGLRVIDSTKHGFAGKCRSSERALSWNQRGPTGLPGMAGATGSAAGWAHVLADGTVDSGHNVTSANVSHPFATGYCFFRLGFVPHAAVVSLDGVTFYSPAPSIDAIEVHIGADFGAGNCLPEVAQAIVHERLDSRSSPEAFSIVFQ